MSDGDGAVAAGGDFPALVEDLGRRESQVRAGAQEPAYLADAMGRAAAEYAKRAARAETEAEVPSN